MPAAFFGHGNPMNALETNRYTDGMAGVRRSAVPRPRAILVVLRALVRQRHRDHRDAAAADHPRLLRLSRRSCSRSTTRRRGCRTLSDEIADVVHPTWVGADLDSWGIDHGTWSVLVHAFPEADIPVVQLSINAYKPLRLPPASSAPRWRRCGRTASWSSAAATSCTTSAASTGRCRTRASTGPSASTSRPRS